MRYGGDDLRVGSAESVSLGGLVVRSIACRARLRAERKSSVIAVHASQRVAWCVGLILSARMGSIAGDVGVRR